MIRVKANAKLNLFLKVYGVRPDGFHDLISVMQSVDLCDTLEFEETGTGKIEIECTSPAVPTDETNLVWKAAERLAKEAGRDVGGLKVNIDKSIPVKGGLAGGSSNCAAALLALGKLWNLDLPDAKYFELGAELGSDVPFCLLGGTVLVSGRGECLEPMAQGLTSSPHTQGGFMLVMPSMDVATAGAYALIDNDRRRDQPDFENLSEQLDTVRDLWMQTIATGDIPVLFVNDFETPVLNVWQELREIYNNIRNHAGHALMSGSGSSMFAWLPTVAETMRACGEYRPVSDETVLAVFPVKNGIEIMD